jgi:plasmid replication initiation protein
MKNDSLCPMIYSKEHYTVMANDIIKGKQEMTLQEARIIRLLVTQIAKQDKEIKTYVCKITDLAKFLNISPQNMYRDIRNICDGLMQSIVRIGTGNPKDPWKIYQWMQRAEYDGNGNLTLELSEQLKPYITELNKWFTQYQLGNILAMQSYYSIRLYELLKCQDGVTRTEKEYHDFSIESLRVYFCCEKKYTQNRDFINNVINVAVKEINNMSDIWLEVEKIKLGKAINILRFFVHNSCSQSESPTA